MSSQSEALDPAFLKVDFVSTGKAYTVTTANSGNAYYIDRAYTVTSVSAALTGQALIKASNAPEDKGSTAATHLKFTLNAPATLYVGYDQRASPLPAWLNDGTWTLTGETLRVSDEVQFFRVYSKSVPAGQVSLGGNMAFPSGGAQTHYVVIAKPNGSGTGGTGGSGGSAGAGGRGGSSASGAGGSGSTASAGGSSGTGGTGSSGGTGGTGGSAGTGGAFLKVDFVSTGKNYTLTTARTGNAYYIDRTYTVSSVSAALNGQPLIMASNAVEDKGSTAATHLKFTVNAPATLYVGYDQRASPLPAWLNDGGFILTNETLSVTDNVGFFRVYSKSIPAGQVSLGGNMAFPAGGAQTHYVVIVKPSGGSGGTGGSAGSGGTGGSGGSGGSGSAGSGGSGSATSTAIHASSDGHYLVNADGTPLYIVGESAWNLVVQPTSDELQLYLNDRQSRGVNALLAQLIGTMGDNPPRADGAPGTPQPFTRAGDFSTPNPTYFSWARSVLDAARSHGMAVFLTPAYYGYDGAPAGQGWYDVIQSQSVPVLRAYGEYLGTTFGDMPNIVWVAGGDRNPTGNYGRMTAIMEGIRAKAPNQLRTAHWRVGMLSTDVMANDPNVTWVTLNAAYVNKGVSDEATRGYTYSPTLPAFMIEAPYLHSFDNPTVPQLREFNYSAWLAGCTSGGFSGRQKVWQFGSSFNFSPNSNWQAELGGPADRMFLPMSQLVRGRAWYSLVPDSSSQLITAGRGTFGELGYVSAGRTPDGKLAIAYLPKGSTAVTVALSRMTGTVTARWYDPTNGTFVSAGTFAASGSQSFSRATANAAGDPDWVLLLEGT